MEKGRVGALLTPPIGLPTKLAYGFGSVAYGVKDAAFRTFLLLYYNQVVGVPAALVSAAIMAALVIDAISDPIVGQFSDNLRTRWGRRHPLMYASALPAAASFLLLWFPPEGLSDWGMFFWIALLASLVRTFITFYEIPSSALAPELTSDYDERTSVASWRYFFGYVGGLGIAFAALWVFLQPTEEYPVGQLNPAGYWTFGLVGAAVMLVSVLASTLGTHHRIRYLRDPPPPERIGVIATLRQMKATFHHAGILAILAFGTLKYTAIGMSAALALYFGTFFWELPANALAILTLDGIIAATLSLAIAPAASRRIGKRNAAIVFAVIAVLVAITPYSLRLLGLFWPNGHPLLVPTLFAFQAVYYTCAISSAVLVHAMIGDVVDDSALKTGRRSEGLFYAANSFMQKCVSGLGVLIAGLLIAAVGLPEGARPGQIDPGIVRNLALLYIPAITLLYLVGAAALWFYRIDRAGHEANLARLREEEPALLPADPTLDPVAPPGAAVAGKA